MNVDKDTTFPRFDESKVLDIARQAVLATNIGLCLGTEPTNAVAPFVAIGEDVENGDGVTITALPSVLYSEMPVLVTMGETTELVVALGAEYSNLNIVLSTNSAHNTPALVAAAINLLDGFTATHEGTTALSETTTNFSAFIPGTPGFRGQHATDELDIWFCRETNLTDTQNSWKKLT